MPRKRRTYLIDSGFGQRKIYGSGGNLLSTTDYPQTFIGLQETFSIPHPFQHRRKTRFRDGRDCGGRFVTQIAHCIPGKRIVSMSNFVAPGTAYRTYDGPIYAWAQTFSPNSGSFVSPSSSAVLDGLGATAISRCLPTNPIAGMGQFLGELRELPSPSKVAQMLPTVQWALKHPGRRYKSLKHASRFGKDAASDYLNFQFGWLPLVKDLKSLFETAGEAEKHVKQWVRDSGRNIRRRYNFPDEVVVETETLASSLAWGSPQLDTSLYNSRGVMRKTTTTTYRRWFSGCFTYYLPKQDAFLGRWRQQRSLDKKLYGLTIDPATVWKIAPWTWATDWVTNFGDVVNNVTRFAQDGLVMRYGYMMETITRKVEYALTDLDLKKEGKVNLTQTYVYTTKSRRRATPYGFGLDPGTFSARQWSIIGALGISKVPRGLDF